MVAVLGAPAHSEILPRRLHGRGGASAVAAMNAATEEEISMLTPKSKHQTRARPNAGKTAGRSHAAQATTQKLQSARRVQNPHSDNSPDPHHGRLAVPKANRPTSLQCCGQQTAQPSTKWCMQRGGSRIRSVASSQASSVKSSASILYRRQLGPDASTDHGSQRFDCGQPKTSHER